MIEAPADRPGLSLSRRVIMMCTLVIAGETIFLLPFVTSRIFRPTILDAFGLTNLQLGVVFSIIGTVGMLGYFPGGVLADKFSARGLMTLALVTTALGGLVYAQIPSLGILQVLYAFWGITTLTLFWAAMIRATREWGGRDKQSSAYGLLDGGRGLTAAILASLSVMIFSALLPGEAADATLEERRAALKLVILFFSGFVFLVSILVWFVFPARGFEHHADSTEKLSLKAIYTVARMPEIWLQALIIVCAYVGMKATADFSLYARDAFGFDDVRAARLSEISFWIRPFAAISVGFLGDWFGAVRMILLC
ncbi:MAG: MFS transporter, partial [Verrucomicrobiae bacterium]|nr:MFS transporter [Verrucomicrobiae bacterium]